MDRARKMMMAAAISLMMGLWVVPQACGAEDDFSSATRIEVNSAVMGNVTEGNRYEQDYYSFVTKQDGYVTIEFTYPRQSDSDVYWWINLYDEEYQELAWMGAYGNKTSASMTTIGIKAGTYYIKVQSDGYNSPSSTDTYTVTAAYTASDYWEKEQNEDFTTATVMDLNQAYYGTTVGGYKYEQDYYRFEVKKNGYVVVNFKNPAQSDSSTYWNVYLYNENYEELAMADASGNNTVTKLPATGIAPGTYYIKVQSDGGSSPDSTDIYSVTAKFTASEYWERENNDDFTSATAITLNETYYGTTAYGYKYETDFYVCTISSKGNYDFEISTPNLKSGDKFWYVTLYNSTYQEISSMDVYGNKKSHHITSYVKKGTYFIEVCSSDSYSVQSTKKYGITVKKTESVPTASISKVKGVSWFSSYKQVNVIMKREKGADGYEVACSTSSDFGEGNTNYVKTSTKKVTLYFRKGVVYYLKVRAYKVDSAGNKLYGAYSSVKKVKIK